MEAEAVEVRSRNQMNKIKRYIKHVPFVLLSLDLIWWVLSLFGIWSTEYWWVLELSSHSLITVGFMAFYAYLHRFCLYSWICIIGIGLINILNLVHYFVDFRYIESYAGFILLITFSFALIKLKKCCFR